MSTLNEDWHNLSESQIFEGQTMTISPDDIQKLAHLARIGIDDSEPNVFAKDVNRIIEWVSILQAAPTQDLEPLTHPHEASSPLRKDEITSEDTEKLFENAPHHQDRFFLVPQVIQ